MEKSLASRCAQIEDLMLEIGCEVHLIEEERILSTEDRKNRVKELIRERKLARFNKDRVSETTVAKKIQKEMRALTIARKRAKIEVMLKQFRELKHITMVKANGKHSYVNSVLDDQGVLQSDRKCIADVFAY